jgi:hypothetical protein
VAIALVFFVIGIGDETVSSSNIVLWIVLLGALAAVVTGSLLLERHGHRIAGLLLAGVLALPAFAVAVLLIVATGSGVRWN